jgi:hypothetical protein
MIVPSLTEIPFVSKPVAFWAEQQMDDRDAKSSESLVFVHIAISAVVQVPG